MTHQVVPKLLIQGPYGFYIGPELIVWEQPYVSPCNVDFLLDVLFVPFYHLQLMTQHTTSEESNTVKGDGAVPEGEVEQGRPLLAVVPRLHDLDIGVASGAVVEVRSVRFLQKVVPELICG